MTEAPLAAPPPAGQDEKEHHPLNEILHPAFLVLDERARGRRAVDPGTRARLARLDHKAPIAGEFWSIYLDMQEKAAAQSRPWALPESSCALLIRAMALMSPYVQDAAQPLGKVLAEAGYSELRLARLLEADAEALPDLIISLTRFLGTKGRPIRWSDLARLLLDHDGTTIRKTIAGDYYRALRNKSKE